MKRLFKALFPLFPLVLIPYFLPGEAYPQIEKTHGLAVMRLKATGVSETEAETLTETLHTGVSRLILERGAALKEKYTLLERSEMDKILEQFQVQDSGCTDEKCAVEFGKMLAVERIIVGSVGLVGSTYAITARLVDVGSSKVTRSVSRTYKGEVDNVLFLIPLVGEELLTGYRPPDPPNLRGRTPVTAVPDFTAPQTVIPSPGVKELPLSQTVPSSSGVKDISFVSISGGLFQMGDVEGGGDSDEKPVHTVTVSGFYMSEAEITNAQYCAWLNGALGRGEVTVSGTSVKGTKGAWSGNEYMYLSYSSRSTNKYWIRYWLNVFTVEAGKENWPVVNVTWYGAKAFSEGNGWDLPREAEWEYACRGGIQIKYGTDDGTINKDKANYDQNGPGHPVDVKSYPANSFGLFDMSGNVWEWCNDWYGNYTSENQTDPIGVQTGSSRVRRGGSWGNRGSYCRTVSRDYVLPGSWDFYTGFRVVRRASP